MTALPSTRPTRRLSLGPAASSPHVAPSPIENGNTKSRRSGRARRRASGSFVYPPPQLETPTQSPRKQKKKKNAFSELMHGSFPSLSLTGLLEEDRQRRQRQKQRRVVVVRGEELEVAVLSPKRKKLGVSNTIKHRHGADKPKKKATKSDSSTKKKKQEKKASSKASSSKQQSATTASPKKSSSRRPTTVKKENSDKNWLHDSCPLLSFDSDDSLSHPLVGNNKIISSKVDLSRSEHSLSTEHYYSKKVTGASSQRHVSESLRELKSTSEHVPCLRPSIRDAAAKSEGARTLSERVAANESSTIADTTTTTEAGEWTPPTSSTVRSTRKAPRQRSLEPRLSSKHNVKSRKDNLDMSGHNKRQAQRSRSHSRSRRPAGRRLSLPSSATTEAAAAAAAASRLEPGEKLFLPDERRKINKSRPPVTKALKKVSTSHTPPTVVVERRRRRRGNDGHAALVQALKARSDTSAAATTEPEDMKAAVWEKRAASRLLLIGGFGEERAPPQLAV